jgi:hypothetical protein
MGHAYLAGENCEEAAVLAVMSSDDDELMKALIDLHEERQKPL